MTDRAQPALLFLTAELRNAITPALIHLDALSAPADEPRPASEERMLERAETRLREVEELASILGVACRAHAERLACEDVSSAGPGPDPR